MNLNLISVPTFIISQQSSPDNPFPPSCPRCPLRPRKREWEGCANTVSNRNLLLQPGFGKSTSPPPPPPRSGEGAQAKCSGFFSPSPLRGGVLLVPLSQLRPPRAPALRPLNHRGPSDDRSQVCPDRLAVPCCRRRAAARRGATPRQAEA